MIKKTLTVAALAAGAVISIAPHASADNTIDTTKYSDATASFVSYDDYQAALDASKNGKLIIVSPYGTRNTIACKGNGADVAWYDCMQQDPVGWTYLNKSELPVVGTAWVYSTNSDPNA